MDKEIKEILLKHDERISKLEELAGEGKSHFERIDQKLEEHSKILEEHSKILEEHSKILGEHSKILNEHTKMLESLNRAVLIIEDAVTNKIPALFDGYKMHQEMQERLEQRVNKVEKVTEMNSIRILALEDKSNIKSSKLSS